MPVTRTGGAGRDAGATPAGRDARGAAQLSAATPPQAKLAIHAEVRRLITRGILHAEPGAKRVTRVLYRSASAGAR